MNRLPIRLRLAAAFAVAMAFLLAGAAWLLYSAVGTHLSRALDQGLRQRAADLAPLVRDESGPLALADPGLEKGESFAEVLTRSGVVLGSSPSLDDQPLLGPAELARSQPFFANRPSVPGLDEPARLYVVPDRRGPTPVLLVVGGTRQNGAETLGALRLWLFVGGPLTLLATSFGGYLLAGAALRPVEDLVARLRAAVARERDFVADASHELRTPLALLTTELELALRHPRTADELRLAVASAAEETHRLNRLAEDLLLIAGAEQGRLPLRPEPLETEALLRRTAAHFAPAFAARGRTVRADADGAPYVRADPVRLEQALRGLVDDALHHGAGDVAITARRAGDAVELHVTDDGPGFPDGFLPKAFERFSRPDSARSGGGTGLGLSIVDAIARAHGGTASAANRPGGGADVWLALPD